MMLELAPTAPSWLRLLMSNCDAGKSWLVNRALAALMAIGSRETAAMVKLTVALTGLKGGVADNVLPQEAVLNFNTRVLPGMVPEDSERYFQQALARAKIQGAEVRIRRGTAFPGSNVTSRSGRPYRLLRQAIQEVWPLSSTGRPLAVAPMLLMGGTDSKHYAHLSLHGVLRFVPYSMNKTAGELGLIHATNERVRVADYPRAVCTYARALQLFGGS